MCFADYLLRIARRKLHDPQFRMRILIDINVSDECAVFDTKSASCSKGNNKLSVDWNSAMSASCFKETNNSVFSWNLSCRYEKQKPYALLVVVIVFLQKLSLVYLQKLSFEIIELICLQLFKKYEEFILWNWFYEKYLPPVGSNDWTANLQNYFYMACLLNGTTCDFFVIIFVVVFNGSRNKKLTFIASSSNTSM